MGKKQTGLGTVLNVIAEGPLRSPLFHWLCKNHDDVARTSAGRHIAWAELCEEFKALGLTGCKGHALTPENARKTWQQVRKEVRKQRALRATGMLPVAAPRQKKLPADWHPSGFTQPNAPSPSGDEHQGRKLAVLPAEQRQLSAPPAAPATTPGSSRPVPGSPAAIREMLNLRSGRKANGDPLF